MIMCVLLCYPVSIHMSQLLSTGCPISSFSHFDSLKNKNGYVIGQNFCITEIW